MKEICIGFRIAREQAVFARGADFLGSKVEEIRKDGNDVVVKTANGDERVIINPDIVWYVEDQPIKLEIVQ